MDLTHPSSGHSQAEDPIKIQHLEEEEHHESGASKMFRKVKARARKFKNSLTKHGNEHDHDVEDEEEDDDIDEQEPEKQHAPVNEVSTARSYRTSEPSEKKDSREGDHVPLNAPPASLFAHGEDENLGGQREVNTETPKRSEHDLRIESTYPAKTTHNIPQGSGEDGVSGIDVKSGLGFERDLPTGTEVESESGIGKDSPARFGGGSRTELEKDVPPRSFEFDQKTESGIDKDSPAGLCGKPETEVRDDFPAKSHEFEQKIESGVGNDSPTRFGGMPETVPRDDFPAKSHEFDQKIESGIGNDSPTRFGGKPETVPRDDFPAKSDEFDQLIESRIGNDSLTGFGGKPETVPRDDFPAKSDEFDQLMESRIGNDSLTGFGGKPETNFPAKSHDLDEKTESGIGNYSPTGYGGNPGTELRDDFPAKGRDFEETIGSEIGKDTGDREPGTERREDFLGKNYEFEQEMESAVDNDSPTRFAGESETGVEKGFDLKKETVIGKESESELDKNFPTRSDDVKKIETDFGTNDKLSPGFSPPEERDDFDSQAEETQEPKPATYTEMMGSATSFLSGKAIATKDVVASSLGYSGKPAGEQLESPVAVQTPENEKVTESGSPVTTQLPLSGGGSGVEETELGEEKVVAGRDYLAEKVKPGEDNKGLSEMITEKLNLGGGEKTTTPNEVVEKIPSDDVSEEKEHGEAVAEKMTPEEEDKAFSEMVAEKLNLGGETKTKDVEVTAEKNLSKELSDEKEHGETVAEEGNGGGMVGKIKGAYNYWLGGTTEEVKPKSPVSVEESSSQSLGSTVGTKGFSDSGESGVGESGGSTGAVPVHRGI
ncbi:unnamed protein product [Thlaspi arvense]|uniref:Uncharacterized protein n=1 Tax=Thlaspi arvense TaxID=13288 RepID=A0AAU9SP79_THLAR|nr:unnamed protein product [Thlaspi arvense]